MPLTIELAPELETKAQQNAKRYGMTLDAYFGHLLENAPQPNQSLQEMLSVDEWIRVFRKWQENLPQNLPALSDEAVSRESIYGDER